MTTAKSPSTTSTSKPTSTHFHLETAVHHVHRRSPPHHIHLEAAVLPRPPRNRRRTTSTPPTPTANSNPSTGTWHSSPSASLEWQWELDHPLSTSSAPTWTGDTTYTGAAAGNPTVYDIDGFDNGAATVAALHARGAKVICYIDVGTSENWRPDAAAFPAALQGSSNGWAGRALARHQPGPAPTTPRCSRS